MEMERGRDVVVALHPPRCGIGIGKKNCGTRQPVCQPTIVAVVFLACRLPIAATLRIRNVCASSVYLCSYCLVIHAGIVNALMGFASNAAL